jgi:hypothetical protein
MDKEALTKWGPEEEAKRDKQREADRKNDPAYAAAVKAAKARN